MTLTLTSTSTLFYSRFTRPLMSMLIAAAATACTIDKDLSTVGDGDTQASSTSTGAGPSTGDDSSTGDTPAVTTGSTSTTEDSSTGDPALACPDHPAIDDCCCLVKEGGSVNNVCVAEQEALCGDVTLQCEDVGGNKQDGECTSANDEALVDCALSALAGQKAGTLQLRYEAGDSGHRTFEYLLVGDGSAYRIESANYSLMIVYEDTGRFELQAPDFFTACLAGTIAEKADCLRGALGGEATEICIPGFSVSDV